MKWIFSISTGDRQISEPSTVSVFCSAWSTDPKSHDPDSVTTVYKPLISAIWKGCLTTPRSWRLTITMVTGMTLLPASPASHFSSRLTVSISTAACTAVCTAALEGSSNSKRRRPRSWHVRESHGGHWSWCFHPKIEVPGTQKWVGENNGKPWQPYLKWDDLGGKLTIFL